MSPCMNACGTCRGWGLWAIGAPCPMGPMDARGGMPTKQCPECKANPNPAAAEPKGTEQ